MADEQRLWHDKSTPILLPQYRRANPILGQLAWTWSDWSLSPLSQPSWELTRLYTLKISWNITKHHKSFGCRSLWADDLYMKVYAHTLLLHSSIPTQPSVIPRATPLWITRAGTYTCLRYVTDLSEVRWGHQDTVALCRSGPSIRSPWRSQSSPHHRRPGPQQRPGRPKLPLMVAYGCHSPLARRSLDAGTNPPAKSPPKLTSTAITSQGAPWTKITGSQESICIWLTATHILATILPFCQATSLPPRTVHKTCWAVTSQNMFTRKPWPFFAIQWI